jgi:acyl-coenzyme A synthetase/AMP-(fatty) acid ligase
MGSHTTALCALPITHGYGYTAGVFAPLSLGGRSVIARPKLASSLAKLLVQHEPEIVVAVPAQYAAWATMRETYRGPLPRIWLCGGAPLPQAVRARFKEAWGSVIAEQYGMTEVGAVTVDLDGAETLGRPYPGVTVRVDEAQGTDDVGELYVSAPYAPTGYIGDTEGAERFTPQGFRTGDNGWFDDEGRLHLVGRRAHQLNVRGQKLDPAEVERAFWALSGVRDVAVLGLDRATGDQWIAAVVVCTNDVTDMALRDATAHLEGYKRPQRVIRVAEIPKNATGKVDFDALRALAREGAAAT